MERDHCDLHPIIISYHIGGEGDQHGEYQYRHVEGKDGRINDPEIMELAIMFDQEGDKDQECDHKDNELREKFRTIIHEFHGRLGVQGLRYLHPLWQAGSWEMRRSRQQ